MRKRSLETFSETKSRDDEEITPKRGRNNGSDTVVYLREKNEMDMKIKKEEMEQNFNLKQQELDIKKQEQKTFQDQMMLMQQQQHFMFRQMNEQQKLLIGIVEKFTKQ